MRVHLLLAAAPLTLAVMPAAAQALATGETRPVEYTFSTDTPERSEPAYESDFTRWARAKREERNPYVPIDTSFRRFDWNKPEPGKGGYFADDYSHGWGLNPATLGASDRVYRGRDLRYYCRRWNGETQRLDDRSNTLLGDTLAAGGSMKLREIADPAVAAAIQRREIQCGSNTFTVVFPDGS